MKGEILRIAERKELDKKKDPTFLLGLFCRIIMCAEQSVLIDILPRINPWDSLDYNNITTPYRSGYSMIFQDLATIGVPHLG